MLPPVKSFSFSSCEIQEFVNPYNRVRASEVLPSVYETCDLQPSGLGNGAVC